MGASAKPLCAAGAQQLCSANPTNHHAPALFLW
jgi:hypothetical protein